MSKEILAFVSDLMFQTRIESAAALLNFHMKFIETVEDLIILDGLDVNEVLVTEIHAIRPKIIIFDLGNNRIPWIDWIKLIKESSVINHIPVICFGSHIEVGTFKDARRMGADEVLARSRFFSSLPALFGKVV